VTYGLAQAQCGDELVNMQPFMHLHVHIYTYIHKYILIHIYVIYIYLYIHISISIYVSISISISLSLYIYILIYIYIIYRVFTFPPEADEISFTMEDEDPFFFRHDSLLPYRHEAWEDWESFLGVSIAPFGYPKMDGLFHGKYH
jgi:hypothetical protein